MESIAGNWQNLLRSDGETDVASSQASVRKRQLLSREREW